MNELTWMTVNGFVYDVENPDDSGHSIQPQLLNVSGFIDFFPGTERSSFDGGFTVQLADLDHGDGTHGDTEVPIDAITARLMNGALCAIAVGDPVGIQLLADVPLLGLAEPLFYHTRWDNVTFGGGVKSLANFAWQATTGAPVTGLAATPSTSGGTLAAGSSYYGVTAKLPGAETVTCAAVQAVITGSTGSVALAWSPFDGAIGYYIYRGTAANALNTLVAEIGSATTYTDTGSAGSAKVAPANDVVYLTSPALQRYEYSGP